MDEEESEKALLLNSDDGLDESPHQIKGATYEEAILATGYGRFHYTLLAMCGWALSSDAIEVLAISFVLPPATCDLHLTNSDKGWLNAIIFVGMMVGGYLWGTLADIRGRRAVLLWSLTVNGLGGLASSFSQEFWQFILLRFISGVGVGGSMPVIFSYFTEFQPKEGRGSMISLLATFWMSGSIIGAGLAWLIIPHYDLGTSSIGFNYHSWQIFLAVSTFPAISSGLFFFLMPESPKFLMETGQEFKALQIFRKMYKGNNPGKSLDDFPIEQLQVASKMHKPSCSDILRQFASATAELFKPPLTRVSVVMTIVYFTLSFGYYGLMLWFPELFNRIEKYGGSPCALGHINDTNINGTTPCEKVQDIIYLESFLTNLANLPGNILTYFIIERVGRKILLAGSMGVSGISVFFIALLKNKTQSLVMSCVFSAISVIGWNSLDVLSVELFPTHLRSTAAGVEMGVGRIAAMLGNIAFGELVDVYCVIPMILVACLLLTGGLSALKLPSTTRIDLK